MKKLSIALLAAGLALSFSTKAQGDKSQRPSPPATATQKIKSGATITIEYSQPSIKGRTIGKDLEPMDNKVWRTGANEATTFETDKDVTVQGSKLTAGKYGLFTLFDGTKCTVIFNKTWKQWGAFNYKEADDALRVETKVEKSKTFTEKMTFTISPEGVVTLMWGDMEVRFTVQ